MPEEIFLPRPHGELYKNIADNTEVVLIYDDVWMWDPRPGAENMIQAVLYVDDDFEKVVYPKHLWDEEYEVVPMTVDLFDEG